MNSEKIRSGPKTKIFFVFSIIFAPIALFLHQLLDPLIGSWMSIVIPLIVILLVGIPLSRLAGREIQERKNGEKAE